jgi:hypothetical protein
MLAVGAAAAGGLVIGLKKSADAAIEAEKANARLQAQLKASGISFEEHEKRIQKVIDAHSQLSGFDDEDLGDSFTNIVRVVGDVNKALDLNVIAMDIARARHMDVAKAGELVGKVAGGNTGILSRYGIVIKDGATATEALAQLQQKFSGQARAYGETTAGAQDRARVAFENLGETIGARVTPIIARVAEGFNTLVRQMTLGQGPGGRIRRVLEEIGEQAVSLAGNIRNLVQWFQRHRTTTTALISVASGLTAAFVAYKIATIAAAVATRAFAAASLLLSIALRANPIGLVVTALIALGTALVVAYKRSDTFRRVVQGAWNAVKTGAQAMWNVIRPVFNGIKNGAEAVARAVGKIAGVFGTVKGAVSDAAGFLNPFGDGLGKVAGDIAGLGGTGGLRGADSDLAPFAAIGARYGLGVSSGIRPGAVTSSGNQSYHASGDAIDMAGSPSGMMRFFQFARQNMGGKLRELIYTPGGVGIKDGKPFHVHVAYTGPFGDGIGQAVGAARAAGFRGQNLINAVAIAGAESGYRNDARLVSGVEDSRGMWQINTRAHPWASNLSNPNANARAAFRVFSQAGGFSPWSVFSSGRYRGFLARARAAVEGSRGKGGGGGAPAAGGGGGGGGGIDQPSKYELGLARVGVRTAKAERQDNLGKLISARVAERRLKLQRLKVVRKALKGKMNRARRLRLLNEEAELVGEIDALTESIQEARADRAGGATTITQAEQLDAGVAADSGGGGGDGGETQGADPNIAILADLVREQVANQQRIIRLTETQGPQILAAVIAAVNGSIGGSLGLGGFQSVGVPGQLARY